MTDVSRCISTGHKEINLTNRKKCLISIHLHLFLQMEPYISMHPLMVFDKRFDSGHSLRASRFLFLQIPNFNKIKNIYEI